MRKRRPGTSRRAPGEGTEPASRPKRRHLSPFWRRPLVLQMANVPEREPGRPSTPAPGYFLRGRGEGLGRNGARGSRACAVRGPKGRHRPPRGLVGIILVLLAANANGPRPRLSPLLLHTHSRFPLTCPRGQWSSLLIQRLEPFRLPSDTTLCHRRFPHPGLQRTTSRLFASAHAHARL